MKRVVITGIGVVSVLGCGVEKVAESLRLGRSGIVLDEERKRLGFQSGLTGQIRDFSEKGILPRRQRRSMPDYTVQAYVAVQEALEMAGLGADDIANERTGLVFGNDSTAEASVQAVDDMRKYRDSSMLSSGLIFQTMNSNVTMNLNVLLGTKGVSFTVSAACSSGGQAVAWGADQIRLGRQDRVICGGAQEINWKSMCSFDALGAFSQRESEPTKASRPFDRGRDGLVPSGGAAAVILESYEEAQRRGAVILGEVCGYGFSSDGYELTNPSSEGLSRAIRGALADAGWSADDVDYICAHATSTPQGDAAEGENIMRVFGEHPRCWISSTKSMTGHELWMSGAAQVVYSVLMARDGFVAPNINLEEPDEALRGLRFARETVETRVRRVLCNSAGFGGTNCALLLEFGGV
ncbi:MAG: beta-ketoacyl-[acyl-carrier-protein] synthase family protein [Lentisphaerae bacterium]|nr:MAG: beta-ketoacyl-[acyl-carrier-protein] synthase family protein [Lentisphaerota bacterium]